MLSTNKMVMTWIGMLPPDSSANNKQRIAYFLIGLVALAVTGGCMSGQAAYFLKYMHIDLRKSLFSLIGVIGLGGALYVGISGIILRYEMAKIYEQLSDIYDSVKSKSLMKFLHRVNATSEWMWKYFSLISIGLLVAFPTISLITVFLSWWIHNDFNVDNFFHPLSIILPWNKTTYWGYVADMSLESMSCLSYMIFYGAVLLLFISMCIYHQTFFEIFGQLIEKLNDCKPARDVGVTLCDMIRFRASIQEWFFESTKVYSPFVLIQLISGGALLSISVYYLESQFEHIDFSLCVLMEASCSSMCTLFVYCYFGTLATESFEKMADALFESNWQDLPVPLQKYLIIMIADMQKPIRYHGFGFANLDLKTFIALIRAVGTYYMMLKTITSK